MKVNMIKRNEDRIRSCLLSFYILFCLAAALFDNREVILIISEVMLFVCPCSFAVSRICFLIFEFSLPFSVEKSLLLGVIFGIIPIVLEYCSFPRLLYVPLLLTAVFLDLDLFEGISLWEGRE